GVEREQVYVTDVPDGCGAKTYAHGALYALRTADGSRVWRVDNVPVSAGAVLATGAIYLSSSSPEGSELVAYRTRDGSPLWRAQGAGGWLWVFDGARALYTFTPGVGLEALSPVNGSVQWLYRTSDALLLLAQAHDILYGVLSYQTTSDSDGQDLVALSARNGKLLWRFQGGTRESLPIVG